jgi:hypothetical protein
VGGRIKQGVDRKVMGVWVGVGDGGC